MKKKRIAIVVGSFPKISETFIVNQIISLIDTGHTVKIFAYKKPKNIKIHESIIDYGLMDKVEYFIKPSEHKRKRYVILIKLLLENFKTLSWGILIKALNPFIYKNVAYLEWFFESLWFIKNKKFDIIHVHFGHNAERIAILKLKGILSSSKLITTFHGFDLIANHTKDYKKKYNNLLEQSQAFTVNSPYLYNILHKITPKGNIHILPVSLDTDYFKREKKPEYHKEFKILFCGRLIELKGSLLTIDIIGELKRRNHKVCLTMIGEGKCREEIENKIFKLDLQSSVKMLGAQTQERVLEEMENSHVFLLPGIHDPVNKRAETQGLVLQEAQAMELPVVISDVGGMKYGIIPDETGFVVRENDITGFADAIEKFILNPQLIVEMGKKGRKFVVDKYDNKIIGAQLIEIYEKL